MDATVLEVETSEITDEKWQELTDDCTKIQATMLRIENGLDRLYGLENQLDASLDKLAARMAVLQEA
jgi:hypothetical protein